jgi:L-lactate dehydrogenase complex protein LldG
MTSRDAILAAVRANQPPPTPAIPPIPLFERPSRSLLEDFQRTLISMGGKFVPAIDGKPLDALVKSLFPDAAVVCSAAPEITGGRVVDSSVKPATLADVDVGIVRAAFGIAETGSVWLSEEQLRINALAYLAQHLLVLLDPQHIVGNLHQAYLDPRFKTARYAVLVTGPSATADIEGILVHGAQGVRSLTVAIVPSPHGDGH